MYYIIGFLVYVITLFCLVVDPYIVGAKLCLFFLIDATTSGKNEKERHDFLCHLM